VKTLIVCVSKYYGNTIKIAEVMASILNAQILEPAEVRNDLLLEFDLIGFGSGIYFAKADPSILELIDKLPKVEGKKAFIFSTRGRNSLFENAYHKELNEKLTMKGYIIIGQFSCRGFSDYHKIFKLFGGVNKGHPNNKELDKAKTFAVNLRHDY